MARKPEQTAELSKSDKDLIRSLEKVIDEALKRGTAYRRGKGIGTADIGYDKLPLYIELPKSASSLNAQSKSELIARYTGAGWKKAELDYDQSDPREHIIAIRLYQ